MDERRPISSIELFCGTGGLALGLHNAGFEHKALYEWNKDSCDNIQANIAAGYPGIAEWEVHQADVRDVSYDHFRGNVQVISGGPPCQPFSLGGKAKANNDARDMFPEAVRAVRDIRPASFIFENVKGLLRSSFAEYFQYIILQLTYPSRKKEEGMSWSDHKKMLADYDQETNGQNAEYRVQYKMVNAADYGVPQSRFRVFIIGFRNDIHVDWHFPEPTHSYDELLYAKWISKEYWVKHGLPVPQEVPLSEKQIVQIKKRVESSEKRLLPWRTVRDAIGDLPDPRQDEARAYLNHDFRPGARSYAGHTGSALDEPSKTIKAGAHGVPGGENAVVLDSGEVRYYTVRESARIQTFPDTYQFSTSWTESMRQIGNAVPMRLAEIMGTALHEQLEGVIFRNE